MNTPSVLGTLFRLGLNDIRLTTRDRAAFFWILLLPVGMMWIFGQTGGKAAPAKARLLIEDLDGGFFAAALRRELEASEGLEVELRPAQNAALPAAGKASEIPTRRLILPAGLSDGVLAQKRQILRLELSQEAGRDLSQTVDAALRRSLVRALGQTVILEAEGRPAEKEALAAHYSEIASRPRLVELKVTTAGRAKVAPQGYAQSVPGILTMIVLMMTLIYGGVFLVLEKETGLLRRQLTLPISRGVLIAGKILGRLLIAGLQVTILLTVGHFFFGLDLGASKAGLVFLMASYAVAVAGLSILLGAFARSREQASTLGWLGSMLLAALGGCWWPAEVMPDWLRGASMVLPTTWAMQGLHQLISYGHGFSAIVLPSAVLLAFGFLFGALGVRALRAF